MIQTILLGLSLGFYTIILSSLFLRYRAEGQTKGIAELIEWVKWFVWLACVFVVPAWAIGYLEELFLVENSSYSRKVSYSISLLSLFAFFITYFARDWLKGKLTIYGSQGKVIYRGRNKDENS